jgi:lysophospholipase L1-like esterase
MIRRAAFVAAVLLSLPLVSVSRAGVVYPEGATTLHFAFEGSPNGDFPVIRPPSPYAPEIGFGFVDSPTLIGNARGAQADHYLRFDADLPEGNYDVTVALGSPLTDSLVTVRAQAHRPYVAQVRTSRGETRRVTFTVNIHKDVSARNELNSDGRFHLELTGDHPSIMKLDIKPNTTAKTLYIAGDSTATDYNADPRVGWGQMFPLFFKPGGVAVSNAARSGRSAKSFIAEKRQEDIFRAIKPGDYLFLQFSHNDQKDAALTQDEWRKVLMTYVDGARERGAQPVLVTSIPRRQFDAAGKIVNSLGEFPDTMRALAKEQKLPLLDLNARATDFLNTLGPEASVAAFTHYAAGTYPNLPAAADNTHLSPYGAFHMARLLAEEIREKYPELAGELAEPPAVETDPAKFPASLAFSPLKDPK